MTYGVLYIDEGNFLNWYERGEDAERAVLEVAQRDPAEASAYGYFAYDECRARGQRLHLRDRSARPARRRRITLMVSRLERRDKPAWR